MLLGKGKACLIDTGLGVANIKKVIDKITSLPILVVTTHVHWDHIGGHRYFDEFAVHEEELKWIKDEFPLPLSVVKQNLLNGNCEFPNSFTIEEYKIFSGMPKMILDDGDEIDLGKRTVKVLHTPGHSPGSLSFYDCDERIVFSGDALFRGSIGRTDLPGGSHEQLLSSIKTKLMKLPSDTLCLSGHGPETILEDEMNHNPFLQ